MTEVKNTIDEPIRGMQKMGVVMVNRQAEIRYKVFEGNSGALTVTLPKIISKTNT